MVTKKSLLDGLKDVITHLQQSTDVLPWIAHANEIHRKLEVLLKHISEDEFGEAFGISVRLCIRGRLANLPSNQLHYIKSMTHDEVMTECGLVHEVGEVSRAKSNCDRCLEAVCAVTRSETSSHTLEAATPSSVTLVKENGSLSFKKKKRGSSRPANKPVTKSEG